MLYRDTVGASSKQKHIFMFHLLCRHFVVAVVVAVVVFHHKVCVSIIFNYFLRWNTKFPLHNIYQSETEISRRKLSVEMYVSVLFKLKYSLRLLPKFNFIRYKKQHVRLLLLHCFCILLLNWDIRLPSLSSFHINHRKIRSNTRINMLSQLTTTRWRYHITFTIAVVIQATKNSPKWFKNKISGYTHYAVLLHYRQNEISDYAHCVVLIHKY